MSKSYFLQTIIFLSIISWHNEAKSDSCANADFYCIWRAPNEVTFTDKDDRFKYSASCKWHGFSLCQPVDTPDELFKKYCSDAIIDPGENEWHYGPHLANDIQWTGEGCFL